MDEQPTARARARWLGADLFQDDDLANRRDGDLGRSKRGSALRQAAGATTEVLALLVTQEW